MALTLFGVAEEHYRFKWSWWRLILNFFFADTAWATWISEYLWSWDVFTVQVNRRHCYILFSKRSARNGCGEDLCLWNPCLPWPIAPFPMIYPSQIPMIFRGIRHWTIIARNPLPYEFSNNPQTMCLRAFRRPIMFCLGRMCDGKHPQRAFEYPVGSSQKLWRGC